MSLVVRDKQREYYFERKLNHRTFFATTKTDAKPDSMETNNEQRSGLAIITIITHRLNFSGIAFPLSGMCKSPKTNTSSPKLAIFSWYRLLLFYWSKWLRCLVFLVTCRLLERCQRCLSCDDRIAQRYVPATIKWERCACLLRTVEKPPLLFPRPERGRDPTSSQLTLTLM